MCEHCGKEGKTFGQGRPQQTRWRRTWRAAATLRTWHWRRIWRAVATGVDARERRQEWFERRNPTTESFLSTSEEDAARARTPTRVVWFERALSKNVCEQCGMHFC